MKKIITLIGVLAVAYSASAQRFLSQSFLNDRIRAIALTNTASKGGWTNLLQNKLFANGLTGGATNGPRNMWTNSAGGYYTNDAVNAPYWASNNFFADVNLWSLRDGAPACATVPTNTWGAADWDSAALGFANLAVKIQFPATMDQVVYLRFVPVPNGTFAADTEPFIMQVAPVASTQVVIFTNAPLHQWVGCAKLRLSEIWTPDNANSRTVWIEDISLNGFVP